MRRNRKTKIVATLGPSSATPERIRALFEAGADVFRINMSHASHEILAERHTYVRSLEQSAKRSIAVLIDLQGPKIRLGTLLGGGHEIVEGEKVHIDGRHGVKVNNAHVVKADVEADNGVIHVIDKVLIPR